MATFTVTTLDDETFEGTETTGTPDGNGLSLREAIGLANANPDSDTITFHSSLAGGTLTLTSGALSITEDVTIDGSDDGDHKADITITGDADGSGTPTAADSGIFLVSGTGVYATFASLTLTGGYAHGLYDRGGAIAGFYGTTLGIFSTTISDNTAYIGGGVYARGTMFMEESTVSGNHATYFGGGVAGQNGSALYFQQATVHGNSSDDAGGGIFAGGDLYVKLSTVTGNQADADGIAISGGGLFIGVGAVTMISSVVAENFSGTGATANDVAGTVEAAHGNFFGTTTNYSVGAGNQNNAGDPGLGGLQDNGGPVQTRNAVFSSALIDAGNSFFSGPTSDANGNARVFGAGIDIGATEANPLYVTTLNDETVGASLGEDIADGDGLSLREAAQWTTELVRFDPSLSGGTIRLVNGQISRSASFDIDGDIDGDNKADITISGDANNNGIADSGDSRIFQFTGGGFYSAQIHINSLNLTNGFTTGSGGAIYVFERQVFIEDTTISNSHAGLRGGGVNVYAGLLDMANSLVEGNFAGSNGGGIRSGSGSLRLTGVTVDGNTANSLGGGVSMDGGGANEIFSSTITNNQADADGNNTTFGGGVHIGSETDVDFGNSVVALNTSGFGVFETPDDVSGNVATAAYSFFGTTETLLAYDSPINGGGDPLLGVLQDNGGTTFTRNPLGYSQLINAGSAVYIYQSHPITLDANGNSRTVAGTPDIGAVEAQLRVTTLSDETAATTDLATELGDGGGLSLREAIAIANASFGEQVTFDPALAGGTLTLTGGVIDLSSTLSIDGDTDGDEAADIVISGGGVSQIFEVIGGSADVDLISLYLTNGYAALGFNRGGAINMDVGTTGSQLNIIHTTIANSSSIGNGGGISVRQGSVTLTNSLLTGNSAPGVGGGIYAGNGANVRLFNSTVYGNEANGQGGGIIVLSSYLGLFSSTISGNLADADGALTDQGGGIRINGAGAYLAAYKSVVAGNVSGTTNAAHDVSGGAQYAQNSFFGTATTITNNLGGNINSGGDPLLGELLDNGGAVLTMSPLNGSLLIDAGGTSINLAPDYQDLDGDGNTAELLPLDGRLAARFLGLAYDIGAVEQFDDEVIGGTAAGNNIVGGLGNDRLNGNAGGDNILGGDGNDTLNGDDGIDTLDGGDGNDLINGIAQNDSLIGGLGLDTLNGGNGNDTLRGDDQQDTLNGGNGDDSMLGGTHHDVLSGGRGFDTIFGQDGNDTITGGSEGDSISGGLGGDSISGESGNDTLRGSDGNDFINGGGNNDSLFGDNGADTLQGATGIDTLSGGAGNDLLTGGPGGDRLDGGTGNDTMNGGVDGNRDTFVFQNNYDLDRINSYEQGIDRLELNDNLWGGGLTEQQVIDTFGTLNGAGTILTLDFGGGDILEVQNNAGITQATLGADVVIV